MNQKAVERYAQSVFEELIVKGEHEVDIFISSAKLLMELIDKSYELKEFFASPAFTENEKNDLFIVLADQLNTTNSFRNLFMLLIEHRRTLFLPLISKEIAKLYDAHLGIEEAVLCTAFEFTDQELDIIREKLSILTENKKIRLIQKIDPKLIGGALIRIKDKVYDASLRSMIKSLKKNIMEIG